jgi:tripeptidyl-peptidase-1
VTAVGGTTQINPETAVSFSGGGFSRLFPTPSYQTEAVSKYLKGLGSKHEGLYKYEISLEHNCALTTPNIIFSSAAPGAHIQISPRKLGILKLLSVARYR